MTPKHSPKEAIAILSKKIAEYLPTIPGGELTEEERWGGHGSTSLGIHVKWNLDMEIECMLVVQYEPQPNTMRSYRSRIWVSWPGVFLSVATSLAAAKLHMEVTQLAGLIETLASRLTVEAAS